MWADNETAEDFLGFAVHEQLIRELVTNDGLLPVTVGVFGDWGGGKSSVLKMLQDQLQNEANEDYTDVACLYFSAWTFEGYDDAKSALLSSILIELGENKKFGNLIQDRVVRLLKLVDLMRLAQIALKRGALPIAGALMATGWIDPGTAAAIGSIGLAAGAIGPVNDSNPNDQPGGNSALKEVGRAIDWQNLKSINQPEGPKLSVREFRKEFSELIAETGLRSLVILIDDLDRCDPDRLVENLEAIKLFLNVPKTAFVIASDNLIVRHAIAHRYRAFDIGRDQPATQGPRDLVTDYIEKLIQIPYHLPKLSPNEIETYITLLFCSIHLREDVFPKLLATCGTQRNDNPNIGFGYQQVMEALENDVPATLKEQLQWSNLIAPALTEGLKGNPRQVKRFLNALLLRKRLGQIAGLTVRDDILVKLMILEYAHFDRFEELYKWQLAGAGTAYELQRLENWSASGFADESKPDDLELMSRWGNSAIRNWLQLIPTPLAEVDLRDYFWIARDRLHGTVSGLSLLSLAARRMIEGLTSDVSGERHSAATLVKGMDARDQADVVRGVKESFTRNPSSMYAFDGLIELHDEGIPGAMEALGEAIMSSPMDQISPDAAFKLQEIANANPVHETLVNAIFERATISNSRFAAAVKAVKETPEYRAAGGHS